MTASHRHPRFLAWHADNAEAHETLGRKVTAILESALREAGIEYLSVTHRVKRLDSALEKIARKSYLDPVNELHDLLGVRVIAFIETDLPRIRDLIEKRFNVHRAKSVDKNHELGADRLGYRSIHYVCDLGEAGPRPPERSDLLFEIQVRTVLQHAWAEILHERKYKFAGVLPSEIERRLNLLAGVLELADLEFADLAARVDAHRRGGPDEASALPPDSEVTPDSLARYREEKRALFESSGIRIERLVVSGSVVQELRDFGIATLRQLDGVLDQDFFSAVRASGGRTTTLPGLLRDAMIHCDIDRYFETAWRRRWGYVAEADLELYRRRWGAHRVAETLRRRNIAVVRPH